MNHDNRQQNMPIHCPHCTNVVAKGFEASGYAALTTKCPHCGVLLSIKVVTRQEIEVEEAVKVTFLPTK